MSRKDVSEVINDKNENTKNFMSFIIIWQL